jgi:ribonuclease P protein component
LSTSIPSARFQRHEHIRQRGDFQRIYNDGRRISGRYGTFFLLPNGLPAGRLGIAATRKFGPAVSRNRAKRLIRDVFRRNKIAPGFDLVVIPKRTLLEAGLSAFEAEFCRLLERRSSR